VGWSGLAGRGVTARVATINGYAFPSGVRHRFSQIHPDLSAEDMWLVEDAVRQWFRLAARRPRARLAMPSLVADHYWQEFARHTRDYASFCQTALGRPWPAHAATQQSWLRETFRLARQDEGTGATVLPLLFRVDSDLAVPDGRHYLPDCGGRGECFHLDGMICLEHVDGVGRPVRRGWRIGEAPPPYDLGEGGVGG
jgi:hypothetical protein